MANPAGTLQYASYVTLVDAKTWLQFASPTTPSPFDAILQRVIDAACTRIQRAIGRPASRQEFFERHDGWSGEYIILKESPFLSLVSCTEYKSSGGPVTLVESTPKNPVDGIQIDYATGRIMRTFAGYSWPRPFFPGSRNIEIIYEAGFDPTPPDLWEATMGLIAHRWRTQQTAAAQGFGGAIGGERGYDPELEQGPALGDPPWIAGVIESYRKIAIG